MPALSPCAKPVEDDEEQEMGLMVAQAQQQQWMQQQSHVCLSKDVSLSVTCGEEDEEDDKRLLLKPKTPETVQI